jgi:hypothetical protein
LRRTAIYNRTSSSGDRREQARLVVVLVPAWVLEERAEHFRARLNSARQSIRGTRREFGRETDLEKGMSSDDLQETLQSFPSCFNHLVREPEQRWR